MRTQVESITRPKRNSLQRKRSWIDFALLLLALEISSLQKTQGEVGSKRHESLTNQHRHFDHPTVDAISDGAPCSLHTVPKLLSHHSIEIAIFGKMVMFSVFSRSNDARPAGLIENNDLIAFLHTSRT